MMREVYNIFLVVEVNLETKYHFDFKKMASLGTIKNIIVIEL